MTSSKNLSINVKSITILKRNNNYALILNISCNNVTVLINLKISTILSWISSDKPISQPASSKAENLDSLKNYSKTHGESSTIKPILKSIKSIWIGLKHKIKINNKNQHKGYEKLNTYILLMRLLRMTDFKKRNNLILI